MGKKASFVAITEEYLISKINTAKTRVAFIGAGFNSNVADAVVKKINPAKDEISERAACGLGKDTEISQRQAMDELKVSLSWLDEQVAKGLLSRRRKGKRKNSPIIYSRLEILALKQAERRAKIMVRQSLQNDEA